MKNVTLFERTGGRVLGILLLVLFASGGCAKGPSKTTVDRMSFVRNAPWIAVSSPRFEIFSTMSEEETKDLARELERFHALIYLVTRAEESAPPVPTRIFAFARRSQFRRFGGSDSAGYFNAGMRMNQIVLSDYSKDLGASEIILHEYVHFVVRNGTVVTYPIWYDEGFAEFLSTARVIEDQMAIGSFPMARMPAFRFGTWISMSRIVSGTSYSDFSREGVGMFYAEAWALVHYLALGRSPETSMTREMARYLSLLELGMTAEAAFGQAFGEPVGDVGLRIRRLLENGKWRVVGVPLDMLEYDRSEPVARIPSETEVAIRLGQLSLSVGEARAAEGSFRAALAADADRARAEAGLGDALKFQGRWEEAEGHFRRAVELDPDDPLGHLDLAEYLHDLALESDQAGRREALLEEARRVYLRSRELDASIPETWAQFGKTYLAPGEDPAASVEPIRHAFQMLPSSTAIASLLAEAYVATDQIRNARRVLSKSVAVREKGSLDEGLDARIEAIRERRALAAEQKSADPDDPAN